jgi:uncharacterized protein YdeI (BOF family)
MYKIILATVFGLMATGAFAQDYDHRDYNNDHPNPGRTVQRFFEGRSVANCRTIVDRHQRPNGDWVVVRRHVCT